METSVIIPARLQSSRFPGKPLVNILGIPMIQHVWERSIGCNDVDNVYIATCDKEIKKVSERFGADVIMTSNKHIRCLDRISEAVKSIQSDYVVVVQGDEPLVTSNMISSSINPDVDCTNLVSNIEQGRYNNNIIKVAVNNDNDVIFMTRQPINTPYRQLCIMGFHRDIIEMYGHLLPSYWEMIESIDMNRFLDYEVNIKAIFNDEVSYPVDVPQDISIVERLMNESISD